MTRGQNLFFRIYNAVRKIPRGNVASYGQIAALINAPRAARIVGWALLNLKPNTKVPWHRVVNKDGMISIENLHVPKEHQAQLLRQEGVEIIARDGNLFVNLKKYLWRTI